MNINPTKITRRSFVKRASAAAVATAFALTAFQSLAHTENGSCYCYYTTIPAKGNIVVNVRTDIKKWTKRLCQQSDTIGSVVTSGNAGVPDGHGGTIYYGPATITSC